MNLPRLSLRLVRLVFLPRRWLRSSLSAISSCSPIPSTSPISCLPKKISQQLSSFPNGASPSARLALPSQTPFRPTSSAVRVNALWFTSLATSTFCALWATLKQQWTRRYVQVADRPYYPPKRARIRAVFVDGVEKFGLAATVEVLLRSCTHQFFYST